jgi:hypothetical protein
MSKRPSFQFYPSDWRTDPDLQLCSIAARGLWIDLICLMHEGTPYGFLTRQNTPIPIASLARLCGENIAIVTELLAELETNNVVSRDEFGALFSRRMVRDEALRNARASNGHLGAQHGAKGGDHGKKGGRPVGGLSKPPLPTTEGGLSKPPTGSQARGVTKPPPSSSSPSSSPSPSASTSEEKSQPREELTYEVGDACACEREAGEWA